MQKPIPPPDDPNEYRYCRLNFQPLQISVIGSGEPTKYLLQYAGTIDWCDDENGPNVRIGAFSLVVADIESASIDRICAHDVFDTTQSAFDVYQNLYDSKGNLLVRVEKIAFGLECSWRQNVLILDRLVVLPEHRGHGVGLLVLRALIQQFRSSAGLVVMKPFPLQWEKSSRDEDGGLTRESLRLDLFPGSAQATTARLRRYYANLGFKLVPRTDYMVMSAETPLSDADTLLNTGG